MTSPVLLLVYCVKLSISTSVGLYAGNVIIFGVDNSLSSHADNLKNNFLVLGEGDTFGNNGARKNFGALEKKLI